jgi:hypothetical protein
MDEIPAFIPTSDLNVGNLVSCDESSGALGHADDVELSLVWIDGKLQESPPFTPDMDRHWAEVDLPILLTRDAVFRFQR